MLRSLQAVSSRQVSRKVKFYFKVNLNFTERVAEQVRTHRMHFSWSSSSLREKVSMKMAKKAGIEPVWSVSWWLCVRRRFEKSSERLLTAQVRAQVSAAIY